MSHAPQSNSASVKAPKTAAQKAADVALNIVAAAFWAYVIAKLFIFDIDVWFIHSVAPGSEWLLIYKFPTLLLVSAIGIFFFRNKSIGLKLLYVFGFPFVVLFWILVALGYILWRQQSWLLVLALLNAGISFFQSFKRNFLLTTLLMGATILVFATSSRLALYACALVAGGVVLASYIFSFLKAFQPSAVFRFYSKTFPSIKNTEKFKFSGDFGALPIEALTPEQQLARTKGIQGTVLYNRGCFFMAKRLRDYQRSRLNAIAYVISLIGLLIVTIFAFALINYSAFKIDPSLFQFSYGPHNFFSFVYYSTGSMFYATNGIAPVAGFSQSIQLIQFLFALFLLVIFLTVIFTMKNERHAEELNDAIKTLEEEGRSAEGSLQVNFNINNIASAIKALEVAKADLLGIILWTTRHVDDSDMHS